MTSRRVVLLVVLALVALWQAAHLALFRPFVDRTPGLDMQGYLRQAAHLWEWPHQVTYYQPAYPFLLRVLGVSERGHGEETLAWVQMALLVAFTGLLSLLIYRVTRRTWCAVAVGLLLAFDVRLALSAFSAMTETLATFLAAAWVYLSWRALSGGGKWYAAGAAVSLFALALTRSMFLLPAVASVPLLWGVYLWRRSAAVRRYALALTLAALPLVTKAALSYAYLGTANLNTGINLARCLDAEPFLVVQLPMSDPLRQYWKQHHSLDGLVHGRNWRQVDRLVTRAYLGAVARHPDVLLSLGLRNYEMQATAEALGDYPHDPNAALVQRGCCPLLAAEGAVHSWAFGTGVYATTTTAALFLGPFLYAAGGLDPRRRLMLGLLLGLLVYTIGVSVTTYTGQNANDDARARLMYEPFALVLWVVVADGLAQWVAARLRVLRRPTPARVSVTADAGGTPALPGVPAGTV